MTPEGGGPAEVRADIILVKVPVGLLPADHSGSDKTRGLVLTGATPRRWEALFQDVILGPSSSGSHSALPRVFGASV